MRDSSECVQGLWEEAEAFVSLASTAGAGAAAGARAQPPLIPASRLATLHNTTAEDSFYALMSAPKIFYNNFAIVRKDVWKDPLWQAWQKHIEASNGIYESRWGDAPIHSIGLSFFLPKDALHVFKDIPYRHLPFIDQVCACVSISLCVCLSIYTYHAHSY